MLIEARNVTKAFGAFKAVDDASVSVEEGEILGLIGPNGAGKSTFFNCLTGDLPPTSGTVSFRRRRRHARCRRRRARELGLARTLPGAAHLRIDVGARQRHDRRLPAPSQCARRARQGARGAASGSASARLVDQPAKQPRHARPQAARDRPRARLRAQGAAARRGDGRPDADRGAATRSSWCARSTAAASPSSSSSTSWR